VPFSWQLGDRGHVLDLRGLGADQAARRPGQQRPRRAQNQAGAARPSVVLVSRRADAELTAVRRLLAAAGVPVLRIDAEAVAGAGLTADPGAGTLRLGDLLVRPTVTWVRHFSGRAVSGPATTARRLFAADSWQAMAAQITALPAVAIAPRPPALPSQLAIASGLGIKVPRTIVTSDPALAASLLDAPRVVVKALGDHFTEVRPGLLHGAFAEIADLDEFRPGRWRGEPPLVVQEFVEHDSEVRAYYAGGTIVAFTVAKACPAEPWLHPERVSAVLADPPAAVAAAAAALARALGLRYGAFDFLIAGGTPVFLEVSPAGDWRWLEARAGTMAVTDAVAGMLRELHAAAAAAPAVPGERAPREALALTAFLASGHGTDQRP